MDEEALFETLLKLITQGDLRQIEKIVAENKSRLSGTVMNRKDHDGFSLLHKACAHEEIQIMRFLIRNGADPNVEDSCGDTPLHWACFSGQLDAVVALLAQGADPLKRSFDRKTPLDAAIEEKHTHILQVLFSHPGVFDRNAIMENVLIQDAMYVKGDKRKLWNRGVVVTRSLTWRKHYTVLSSMIRAVFIFKTKDMSDSEMDVEHFLFQEIVCVRKVLDTSRRFKNRRFNVYFEIPHEHYEKLKFSIVSCGFDRANEGEDDLEGAGEGSVSFKSPSSKNNNSASSPTSSSAGPNAASQEKKRGENRAKLAGFRRSLTSTFRRRSTTGLPPPPPPPTTTTTTTTTTTSSSSPRTNNTTTMGNPATMVICIAFLAEDERAAKRWMDSFKNAGRQGRNAPAVTIQTCWRAYKARMLLRALRVSQLRGSDVVRKRGSAPGDERFVPLDASYTRPVDPPPGPTRTELVKRAIINSNVLARMPLAGSIIKEQRKAIADQEAAKLKGLEMGHEFRRRRSNALAAPVGPAFHNAEDISGYLKKRSNTGASSLLRMWKKRFVILSHVSAELQYFDPSVKDPSERQIRRIPFSKLLQVTALGEVEVESKSASSSAGPTTTTTTARSTAAATSTVREKDRRRVALGAFSQRGGKSTTTKQRFRFVVRVLGGESYFFQAKTYDDMDRWVKAIARVLPRDNVAALQIQRVVRGFLARTRLRRLKRLAVQKALMMREEVSVVGHRIGHERTNVRGKTTTTHVSQAMIRVEEARQRSLAELELRAANEELAAVQRALAEEKEHRRRSRALKRMQRERLASLPLDPAWAEHRDKKTGRPFYHNRATGETRWEKPVVGGEESEDSFGSSSRPDNDSSLLNTSATNDGARRSGAWEELVDASSGEVYYYNHDTGVSTWTKPPEFDALQGEEVAKEGGEETRRRGASGASESSGDDDIVNDAAGNKWSRRLDVKSGHYYYYNEATGVSQWEHPNEEEGAKGEEEDVDAEEEQKSEGDVAAGGKSISIITSPNSSSGGGKSAATAASGKSSEEAPLSPMSTLTKALDDKARLKRKASGGSTGSGSSSTGGPRDEWVEYSDPSSGAPFYVNLASGEKTWRRPAALGGVPTEPNKAWVAMKDASGRAYFSNPLTGESAWELPSGAELSPTSTTKASNSLRLSTSFASSGVSGSSAVSSFPFSSSSSAATSSDPEAEAENEDALAAAMSAHADSILSSFHASSSSSSGGGTKPYIPISSRGGLFACARSGTLCASLLLAVLGADTLDARCLNGEVDESLADPRTKADPVVRARTWDAVLENHALVINAVRASGGRLSREITPRALAGGEDIFTALVTPTSGTGHSDDTPTSAAAVRRLHRRATLELVWEILQGDLFAGLSVVRFRPLLALHRPKRPESLKEFHGLQPTEILKRWLEFHVRERGGGSGIVTPAAFGGGGVNKGETAISVQTRFLASLAIAIWSPRNERRGELPFKNVPPLVNRLLHDSPGRGVASPEEIKELATQIAEACKIAGVSVYADRVSCLLSTDARMQIACCCSALLEMPSLPRDGTEGGGGVEEGEEDEMEDEDERRRQLLELEEEDAPEFQLEERSLRSFLLRYFESDPAAAADAIRPETRDAFVALSEGVLTCQMMNLAQRMEMWWDKVKLRPKTEHERILNCTIALEWAKHEFLIPTDGVGAFDFVDVNRPVISPFIWRLAKECTLARMREGRLGPAWRGLAPLGGHNVNNSGMVPRMDKVETEADLLLWVNERVRIGITVRSFAAQKEVRFVESPVALDESSSSSPSPHEGLSGDASITTTDNTPPSARRSRAKRSSLRTSGSIRNSFNARDFGRAGADIASFSDPSLATGTFVLALLDAVRPGCVDWKRVVPDVNIEDPSSEAGGAACEGNAKYAISVACKIGMETCANWMDVAHHRGDALVVGIFVPAWLMDGGGGSSGSSSS